MIEFSPQNDRAVLVGIRTREGHEQAMEYLNELEMLTYTSGAETVHTILQQLDKSNVATYVGSGKLAEIKQMAHELKANLVIFDDELTPTQLRNIEREMNKDDREDPKEPLKEITILDRSGLILQIFSQHARTAQAKAQVELAKLQYMLPRLTRMWTHLSRERGGIGMKGAGEQEIETDRRIIRTRIAKLKEELQHIERQSQTRRKGREDQIRISLIGYTNVGKSTLMNLLSKSDVLAENKLFATLDTTTRKIVLDGIPILLSDTVGFIRKLPHHLIESFKSTLAEVSEADILLHVVDISNPHYIEQINVVRDALAGLKAAEKPTIMVFNKIDKIDEQEIADLEKTWMFHANYPAVFLSATEKENIDRLRQRILEQIRLKLPEKYQLLAKYISHEEEMSEVEA